MLHNTLENLVLKNVLAREGQPFKIEALDELPQRIIAPVKLYRFSQRAERTGILELGLASR